MEIILALHNIRSTYNVGAILRTAEGFALPRVICSGYTPVPASVRPSAPSTDFAPAAFHLQSHNPKVLPHLTTKITAQIAKTALGAERLVATWWSPNLLTTLHQLRSAGWQILGLENNIKSSRLISLPDLTMDDLSDRIVLVLGEEVSGIPKGLYPTIDRFLEIPMQGQKESFNVSVAAGIALYGLLTAP